MAMKRNPTLVSDIRHECDVLLVLDVGFGASGIHDGLHEMRTTASTERLCEEGCHVLSERRVSGLCGRVKE
jgi:hypothetical protein